MPSTPQPMICGRQGDDAGQASEESAPTLISPLPSRPTLTAWPPSAWPVVCWYTPDLYVRKSCDGRGT